MSSAQRGLVVDAIATARVRELLVSAQQPLIGWLDRDGCQWFVVTVVRELSGKHEATALLLWLAESENIQMVFRRIRAFIADDAMDALEPALDLCLNDGDRVRETLLRSINQVTYWIEDERNAAQLLSVLREVGETVDMSVIVQRFERDPGSGHRLAQRAFQSIRLLMPGGRPNSGLGGFAGLAARVSFV